MCDCHVDHVKDADPQQPKSNVDCSLVVNVGLRDYGVAAATLPHMVRTHRVAFAEICVVLDETPPTGRLSGVVTQSAKQDLLDSLHDLTPRPEILRVDRTPSCREIVNRAWFGHPAVADRCAGGTPLYPYVYGLHIAKSRYRLHADCDMLFCDPGPTSWIEQAIRVLGAEPDVMFVNQMMGPGSDVSCAPEFYAPIDQSRRLRLSQEFSSRCFLFDFEKLRQFLPIAPASHGLMKRVSYLARNRSGLLPFEQMVTHHLHRTASYRCDLPPEFGFTLHAWDKMFFASEEIGNTISSIETGWAPDVQQGKINLIDVW